MTPSATHGLPATPTPCGQRWGHHAAQGDTRSADRTLAHACARVHTQVQHACAMHAPAPCVHTRVRVGAQAGAVSTRASGTRAVVHVRTHLCRAHTRLCHANSSLCTSTDTCAIARLHHACTPLCTCADTCAIARLHHACTRLGMCMHICACTTHTRASEQTCANADLQHAHMLVPLHACTTHAHTCASAQTRPNAHLQRAHTLAPLHTCTTHAHACGCYQHHAHTHTCVSACTPLLHACARTHACARAHVCLCTRTRLHPRPCPTHVHGRDQGCSGCGHQISHRKAPPM